MDKSLQNELFGSDSEDEEEAAPPPPAPTGGDAEDGVEEEGDDNIGEDDLFGEDDEEEEAGRAAPRPSAAPERPSAPPLHYELPLLPRPDKDSELYAMRLPNILGIEPRPFDPAEFEGDDEQEGAEGEEDKPLGGKADNVIRWREGLDGVRQSNARIITWSDGSMTLHVGSEVLTAVPRTVEGGTQLFTRHKGSNLECHGIVKKKLVLQPASIQSSTHKALTKRIAKNHVQGHRIQTYTTTQDPEKKKREDERTWDDKNKLTARQQMRAAQEYGDGQELSAGFLDADDDIEEGNLGALKDHFRGKGKAKKGGRRGAAASSKVGARAAFGGKRPRSLGQRDDSDDDDDEEEEEEEEQDTGEMRGFIVDDEEAEASDSEEEAAESDDDDDEEEFRAPKKRGRK